jgi:ribosomal protein S18 acetylase RimI-like enzyme
MAHILDNPIWNALITGNAALAEGDENVKLFPADIAPFVGLREINPDNIARLYERVTPNRVVAIVAPTPIEIPAVWKVLARIQALQMIYQPPSPPSTPPLASAATNLASAPPPATAEPELTPLGNQHIPAMLELTALTNPGPFYQRTIRFGSYTGIFAGAELVAMAGFRMHPGDFIEVSAVCTRPSHLGRGYARALITHLVGVIRKEKCTAFLHVRADNARAIEVYHQLGFTTRHEMTINFIKKRTFGSSGVS